jgi:hypothetical protein
LAIALDAGDASATAREGLKRIPQASKSAVLKKEYDSSRSVDDQLISAAARLNGVDTDRLQLVKLTNNARQRVGFDKDSVDSQLADWSALSSISGSADYKAYLTKYPDGVFAELALASYKKAGGQSAALPQNVRDALRAADYLVRRDLIPWQRDGSGRCKADLVVASAPASAPASTASAVKSVSIKKKVVVAPVIIPRPRVTQSGSCVGSIFGTVCGVKRRPASDSSQTNSSHGDSGLHNSSSGTPSGGNDGSGYGNGKP